MDAVRRGALALAALVVLAGCDGLALEPENPRDPLFGEGRVPTGPDAVRLASATATRATLTWESRSSFATAFVVGQSRFFEGVDATGSWVPDAEVPTSATTLTVEALEGAGPYYFAVRAEADGVRSTPSAVLKIARPFHAIALPLGRSASVTASAGPLAAVSTSASVTVLDVPTRTTVATYPSCQSALALAADGTTATVCDGVHVYRDGRLIRDVPLRGSVPPVGLALTDDGRTLMIAERSVPTDRIRVVQVSDGTTVEHVLPESGRLSGAALSRDGRRVAYVVDGNDPHVRSWSVGSDDVDWSVPVAQGDPLALSFGDDGRLVVARSYGVRDGVDLRLLDGATGSEMGRQRLPDTEFLTVSATGRTLTTRPRLVGPVTVRAVSPTFERILDVPAFDRAPFSSYGSGDRTLLAYASEAFAPDGTRGVLYVRDLDAPWQVADE